MDRHDELRKSLFKARLKNAKHAKTRTEESFDAETMPETRLYAKLLYIEEAIDALAEYILNS